jgi:CubicO group peptidase (beta-lactamase class C family)
MLRVAILTIALMLGLLVAASAKNTPTPGVAAEQLKPLPAQPAGTPWPTTEWPEAQLGGDVDQATLDLLLTQAFGNSETPLGETRAVLIVQGGRVVKERYGDGYDRNSRLISWSMAKSFTGAFVAAAVLQHRLNPDQPMGNPHWAPGDPRGAISWRMWMQMVDGQPWSETHAVGVLDNDSARMLFGEGRNDTAAFGASRRLIHAPGSVWNYNSGGIAMVADALTRIVVPDPQSPEDRRNRMRAWMDQVLFTPTGMHPIVQFDPSGTFYGSAEIYATARDFARFGLLYLRDGMWDHQRLLPEGWVDFVRTPGPDVHTDIYGATWWLSPRHGTGSPVRGTITDNNLSDVFSAQGHEGQLIMLVPSKDLVVVRLGHFPQDTGASWNALGDWMQRVIQCFPNRPSVVASR